MRKLTQLLAVLTIASLPLSVGAVSLGDLETDFETLMNGVARDVTPTLSMTALSGDIIGEAGINGATFAIGVGATLSPGIATAMADPNQSWQFGLPGIIDTVAGTDGATTLHALEGFMPYPGFKLAFGLGFGGGWDGVISGYILQSTWITSIVNAIAPSALLTSLDPKLDVGSIGVKVRKVLIPDQGPIIPGFSIGLGYNFTSFSLSANIDLASLVPGGVTVAGQPLSLKSQAGKPLSFVARSHNVSLDLQLSKKWLILTLFNKLSGVVSAAHFEGSVNLDADLGALGSQTITANPLIDLTDVAALYTAGLELDFVVIALDVNLVVDIGHASLNISDFSLTGIKGNGVSVNAGIRIKIPGPAEESPKTAPADQTASQTTAQ